MKKILYIASSLGLALPFLSFAQTATSTAIELPEGWLAFIFGVAQQQITNFWYLAAVAAGLSIGFAILYAFPGLLGRGIRAVRARI